MEKVLWATTSLWWPGHSGLEQTRGGSSHPPLPLSLPLPQACPTCSRDMCSLTVQLPAWVVRALPSRSSKEGGAARSSIPPARPPCSLLPPAAWGPPPPHGATQRGGAAAAAEVDWPVPSCSGGWCRAGLPNVGCLIGPPQRVWHAGNRRESLRQKEEPKWPGQDEPAQRAHRMRWD